MTTDSPHLLPGNYARIQIGIGMMLVIALSLPSAIILKKYTGGMYGPVFKHFSPAFYHLVTVILKFGISASISWFLIFKLKIWERLNPGYSSSILFSIGNYIILTYLVVRIFASTIQGGGPALVVSMYGAYPLLLAKIILYIAMIRIFIGLKPLLNENLPGNNKTKLIKENSFAGIQIWIGLILITMSLLPFDILLRLLTLGNYATLQKASPILFRVFFTTINIVICVVIVRYTIRKMSLWERIQSRYASTILFTFANSMLLFYMVISFLPIAIKKPIYSIMLYTGGVYQFYILKIILIIAFIRLLIGIMPRTNFIKSAADNRRKDETSEEHALRQARKYLQHPVSLNEFMKISGKSSNTIMDEISQGSLKGYEYNDYLFIETDT